MGINMSVIKSNSFKKMKTGTILLISSLITLIVGFVFMITYWLGEVLGIAPVITLGSLDWFTSGEGVLLFTTFLLTSIFLGSFLVLYLLKKIS